jgi:hypothetical protein
LGAVEPTAAPAIPATTDLPSQLWFPTVTMLQASPLKLIVTGSLENKAGGAISPPSFVPFLVSFDQPEQGKYTIAAANPAVKGWSLACGGDSAHLRSAAFDAALLLPGQRVLSTGGTPRSSPACMDCEGSDQHLTCALHQAVVYDAAGGTIAPNPASTPTVMGEGMQVPRFGHSMSLLPDGTVLVVGGVTRHDLQNFGVTDVEVYNPARRAPPVVADMMSGTMIDADDPVLADLQMAGLSRMPGTQAFAAGGDPSQRARPCSAPQ